MDIHVEEFFCQFSDQSSNGRFHKVIALHEEPSISWNDVVSLIPHACKGWYELSHLDSKDRIEFLYDFWIAKMPFHPKFNEFLIQFFESVDDIGIFITQKMFDVPYEAHLVYSLANDSGFFRGELPASPAEIEYLQKLFPHLILPEDYLAFMQIHNGFGKATDKGLIPINRMWKSYQQFQEMLKGRDPLLTIQGNPIDPRELIPFYESFSLPCYHCFWSEWYPGQEMGNVYYSGLTHTISNYNSVESSPENLTFPTFTDWLMFYLERIG